MTCMDTDKINALVAAFEGEGHALLKTDSKLGGLMFIIGEALREQAAKATTIENGASAYLRQSGRAECVNTRPGLTTNVQP